MKICFDARVVAGKRSGIPRFTMGLLRHVPRLAPQHGFIVLARGEAEVEIAALCPAAEVVRCEVPVYSISEQWRIPRLLKRLRPDLYHSPTYAAPVRQPVPTIVTIHDLIPMVFPQYFRLIHRLYYPHVVGRAARKAAAVMTVSECSKGDVVKRLRVPESRVHVVGEGADETFSDDAPAPPGPVEGEYVLGVGNEKPHKQIACLVKAFGLLTRQTGLGLVLVGPLGADVKRVLAELPSRERVVTYEHADDSLLKSLYRHAAVFVFPSLYEGFGLPPVEAMACGTPVIVADTPALVETVADAALVVPRSDPRALSRAMERLLGDEVLRNDLIRKGSGRARELSWAKAAARVVSVYDQLAETLSP